MLILAFSTATEPVESLSNLSRYTLIAKAPKKKILYISIAICKTTSMFLAVLDNCHENL